MVLVNRDCLNPRPHMVLLQENHAIPSALRLMGIIHVLLKGYHFCIHSNVNFTKPLFKTFTLTSNMTILLYAQSINLPCMLLVVVCAMGSSGHWVG